MMIKLKVEYKGEIRRSQVTHPLTMDKLCDTMQQLFDVDVQEQQHRVSYVDDEGDTIVVTGDIELLEAASVFAAAGKAVRLSVEPFSAEDEDEEAEAEEELLAKSVNGVLGQLPEAMKLFGDYVSAGVPPPLAGQKVLAEMPHLAEQADEARHHFRQFFRGFCARGRGGFDGRGFFGRGRGRFGGRGRGRGCRGRGRGGFFGAHHRWGHGPNHRAQMRQLAAEFVQHVTLPDATPVCRGSVQVKSWLLKNTGSVAWPEGTQLRLVKGSAAAFDGVTAFDVPLAQPGETVEVSVPLTVPQQPAEECESECKKHGKKHCKRHLRGRHAGRIKALFRLAVPHDADAFFGRAHCAQFGDRLWINCDIVEEQSVAQQEPEVTVAQQEPESEPEPKQEPEASPEVQQARALLGDRVAGLSDAELSQLLLAFGNDVVRFARDVFGH